jgi:O-antigen ligase
MSPLDFSARQGVQSWAAKVFIVAIAVTALAYGSVAQAPLHITAATFAMLTLLSLFRPIGNLATGRVYAAAILLLAAVLFYIMLQALPLAAGGFVNEAWKSVNDLVGPIQGTISVAPGMTLDSLPRLALPFLVFLSALALFQGDEEAMTLWRALAYFGLGYAVFGILQDVLLPDQLLFAEKRFYVGNLTASFVNRNTAGTFFGVALLLNIGLVFHYLRKIYVGSFVQKVTTLDISWRDKHAVLLLHASFCLIIAVALFLTQSRGAVGASFIGVVVGVVLMATRPLTADKPNEHRGRWRRYATMFAAVVVIIGVFSLFAGRSVYRMESQGSDDGRWCSFASTLQAIKDHPIFGTGFGTFQDVFPAYRNVECGGIYGVWDRAHNFFLEGYLGLGVPFALCALVGYAVLIAVFLRGLRNRHKYRFIPVMGLATLVLTSLHSIVDFSLQIPGFNVYFAAVIAATASIALGGGGRKRSTN